MHSFDERPEIVHLYRELEEFDKLNCIFGERMSISGSLEPVQTLYQTQNSFEVYVHLLSGYHGYMQRIERFERISPGPRIVRTGPLSANWSDVDVKLVFSIQRENN